MPRGHLPPPPLPFFYAIWQQHQFAYAPPPVPFIYPQLPHVPHTYPAHPLCHPLPLEPVFPVLISFPYPLLSLHLSHRFSNCLGPIIENVHIFNHRSFLDLSHAFRVNPVREHEVEHVSTPFADLTSEPMDSRTETTSVEERLEERAVTIITEILKRSVKLVHEDEREDRIHINAKDLDLTKAPISWLYILHLEPMISKGSRRAALSGLQTAITSLNGSIEGQRRNVSSSSQLTCENSFLSACRDFGTDLSSALSALRRRIEGEESELEILKSMKTVFELTFFLYYREKGCCTPASQNSVQHLEQLHISSHIDRPVAGNSVSAFQGTDTLHTSPVMQPHEELNTQNGTIQNGTAQNGKIQNGAIQNGMIQNGTAYNGLQTIFTSHIVPMTPVVARSNSVFVSGTNPGDLHILQAAYAYVAENGSCVIPCEFCLNATYIPENAGHMFTAPNIQDSQRQLTYVGCRYPDGTSLSYIPISDTKLVYDRNLNRRQPIMRTGTVTFAFLHVYLPNAVYQEIKQRAKHIYLLHHPNTQFVDHHETRTADGRMVKIEVLVKSERTVRIVDRNRQLDYPVLQALFGCGHDICGPSLMHMRFTSTKRGMQRLQLRLILFGITVTRTQENYDNAIFRLLDSPPGPIHAPESVPAPYLS